MAEIKVVENTSGVIDIDSISAEDRAFIFERLAQHNPTIDKLHFENFNALQVEWIKFYNLTTLPELRELTLRKILELIAYIYNVQSSGLVNSDYIALHGYVVVPVVDESLPRTPANLWRRLGAVNVHARAIREYTARVGGDAARPLTKIEPTETHASVRVQFKTPTRCITPSGITRIIYRDDVDVVGFVFVPMCDERAVVQKSPGVQLRREHQLVSGTYAAQNIIAQCPPADHSTVHTMLFGKMTNSDIDKCLHDVFEYLVNCVQQMRSPARASFAFDNLAITVPTLNALAPQTPRAEIHKLGVYGAEALALLKRFDLKTSDMFSLNMQNAFVTHGLQHVYTLARLRGIDSESVVDALADIESAKTRRYLEKKSLAAQTQDRYIESSLMKVIGDKLGITRMHEVEHKLKLRVPRLIGMNILAVLTEHERKLISTQYEQRIKRIEAALTNKCPHVRINKRFRRATSDADAQRWFGELAHYFAPAKRNAAEMIKCTNCSFDIICPHLKLFSELTFAGKKYAEITAAMNSFIGEVPHQSNYYCKICSELISESQAMDSISESEARAYDGMPDETRSQMWSEVSGVMRYVSFSIIVNTPKFIAMIISKIYSYVIEIEKQLLKSKTNTSTDIQNKKALFIVIYTYAYLVHLISSAGKKKSVIDFNGAAKAIGKSATAQLEIADYLKFAIVNILATKYSLLQQLPGVTNEFIRSKVIDAYRVLATEGPQVIITSDQTEDVFVTLVLDPIYHYLYYINMIDTGKSRKTRTDPIANMPFVMGDNVNRLRELPNGIYTNARIPQFTEFKWHIDKFNKMTKVTAENHSDIVKGYIARSFEMFWMRQTLNLHNQIIFASGSTTPEFIAYSAQCDKFQVLEQRLLDYESFARAKNTTRWIAAEDREFVPTEYPLGNSYDTNGHPHVFDSYIIDGAVVTEKEIDSAVSKGNKYGKITDRVCSVCGTNKRDVAALDQTKIRQALDSLEDIKSLYMYYENRCPNGGLHQWKIINGDSQCEKCSLTFTKAKSHNDEYYKTNLATFRESLVEDAENERESQRIEVSSTKTSLEYPEYKKWSPDLGKMMELSSRTGHNNNQIVNLGNIEGEQFDEVTRGKFASADAKTLDDTRIYLVGSYVAQVIIEYNQLRNHAIIANPNPAISECLARAQIRKHQFGQLATLPKLYDDFYLRLQYFRANKSPAVIIQFLISSFVDLCLRIATPTSGDSFDSSAIRTEFTRYIVGKILAIDENRTVHGQVNWDLFRSKSKVPKDQMEDNEIADDDEEDVSDDEAEDGPTDTNAALRNNYDIDTFDGDEDTDVKLGDD